VAESASPLRVVEETTAYWRVVFDYPPFNVMDGSMFQSLQDLLGRMDASETLRVVVFESAIPDFYLAHFDLTGKLGNVMSGVGPSGLPILIDTFVRITKSPVVSIAKIRGCVRGASSEFVLACDMRFASRENTRLGQHEVAVGLHPGGGGAERLPHLVGRGRAGLSLARIHSGRIGRRELREMDVLGDRVPHSAATHQLVPVIRSACAFAERRHRYGLDGQPPD
jgi:enoyl-CoA hydratase/carnithine racemase